MAEVMIANIIPKSLIHNLQFEPGFGASEHVYAWSVSVNNIGGLLGGICGGLLASTIPYWYSFLIALLFNVIGFLVYAIAQYDWMIIIARLMIGTFSGLQHSLVYAYIGVSYQQYIETKRRSGLKTNETKYCRVKDIVFSLYTISTSAGYFLGSGFSAILAQFRGVDHFRAVGWYNFSLGVLAILLLFVAFHGESNWKQTYGKEIKSRLKSGVVFFNSTTFSTLFILGFLLLCTGVIKSRTAVYELLLNPILSDTFGFSESYTNYFFLVILAVPVFGGLLLFLLEWSKISNLLISILGIIASIIGLAVMSDWQAIRNDPCLDYSLYHHPELATNMSLLQWHPPPTATCWNTTSSFLDFSDFDIPDSHLVLNYNPFMYNDAVFNCRLHVSTSVCYGCGNSTLHGSPLELNFQSTQGEICYNSTAHLAGGQERLKLSIVCDGSDFHCLSACFHIQNHEADMSALKENTKQLFHHTYKHSLLLLHRFVYDTARNKCKSAVNNECHWIPDSLITRKTCTDCLPLCRGLSQTMNFIQFVVGSMWFMFTYPVAEVALPVVISDSVEKEFQGIMMGLTVAITELFQSITPQWLMVVYESAQRRTFLPMITLITTFLPFLLGLMILYRKLILLRDSRENCTSSDTGEEIFDMVNQTELKHENLYKY